MTRKRIVLGTAAVLIVAAAYVWVPLLIAQWGTGVSVADERRNFMAGVIGLGAFGTLYYAHQRHELQRDENRTSRYSQAVEQLGSEQLATRLGGIYALERVARDSPGDTPVVIEVLSAFARASGESSQRRVGEDTVAAVTVLGRGVCAEWRAHNDRSLDLRGVQVDGAMFPEGLDLSRMDARNGSFRGARLDGALLLSANFEGVPMDSISLQGANLSEGRFGGAVLSDGNLRSAGLVGAQLTAATLNRADLQDTRLHGANLQLAKLEKARLDRAELWEAQMTNTKLGQASFLGADLRGANLAYADLTDALLSQAVLTGAILAFTKLTGADLNHAVLREANLAKAVLDHANLSDADLRDATMNEVSLANATLNNTKLTGASMEATVLTDALLDFEEQLSEEQWGTVVGDPWIMIIHEPPRPFRDGDPVYRRRGAR